MLIYDLFESFDRVLPYSWFDRSNEDMKLLHAEFMVGDGHFIVQFKSLYYNPGVWELSFTRNKSLDLSATGSASTIISTVMHIAREFIRDINPRYITFLGKNAEASRNKLYPKLFTMMMKEFPQYFQKSSRRLRSHTDYTAKREDGTPEKFIAKREPEPEPVKPAARDPRLDGLLDEILDDPDFLNLLFPRT